MVCVKHLSVYQVYDRIWSDYWIGPEMFDLKSNDEEAFIGIIPEVLENCKRMETFSLFVISKGLDAGNKTGILEDFKFLVNSSSS